jgi:DNA helicase IV
LGIVEVVQNDIISTLYDLRNDENSIYNFVLELGEQAKIIYEDFIDFMPPWEEQYENVENSFDKNGLAKKSYYFGVFEELKKLGADKVYIIKDTFAPELSIPENATMESYLKIIQKETTFFEVPLTNN